MEWVLALVAAAAVGGLALALRLAQQRLALATADAASAAEHQRELLDGLDTGPVLWDLDDRLILWKRDFEQLYGAVGDLLQPGLRFAPGPAAQHRCGSCAGSGLMLGWRQGPGVSGGTRGAAGVAARFNEVARNWRAMGPQAIGTLSLHCRDANPHASLPPKGAFGRLGAARRRPMTHTALILAAGRGERLRPHTDHTPKPLLPVRGRPLIEWHLQALAAAGVSRVAINTAWLEDQFPAALGDGRRWGLQLHYSMEGREYGGALETAGGIAKALPQLGEVFWVVSGDVFLPGFPFGGTLAPERHCHLWLVPNAPHHPQGDFGLAADGRLTSGQPGPRWTWASAGLFRRAMFEGIAPGTRLPLRPVLENEIAAGRAGGEVWDGDWTDVGTADRWAALG